MDICKKEDCVMNFSEEEVNLSDMIYPSDFLKKISPNALEGFYHGRTSGGITNDDTSEACKVIYDLDDGNIKLLYIGKIKDGKFNDDFGDTFEIVYSQNLGK